MAGIRLEWAQFGDFDSFEVIRSDTSMAGVDDVDLPSPIVTGLSTMFYVDTTVVIDATYYYKIRALRDSESVVSDELQAKAGYVYAIRADFTTDLTDQTGKTWTAYGDAAVSSGALQLLTAGDYLDTPFSADFHFGSGEDVTLRCKPEIASFGSDRKVLLTTRKDTDGARNWSIYATQNGIRFLVWGIGTTLIDTTWSSAYTFGTEFELSLERKEMEWRLYIDNDQFGSSVTQTDDYDIETASELTIGSEVNAGGGTGRDLIGSMQYVQIIKGRAVGEGSSTTLPIV